MPRERAQTYADRLPPLVPKQEDDISHLPDEMADLLYPGRRPRPFRMAVVFDAFDGPDYERACALAREAPEYHERQEAGVRVHEAGFGVEGAGRLRDLFQLVGSRPGTEVLMDRRRVPYAREIWLPLYWLFVASSS